MLSVCVTVKNRHSLFQNCVRSLQICCSHHDCHNIELVVSDWGSTDAAPLAWLPPGTTVVPVRGEFSRGRGLNAAARAARFPYLFFIDADMLLEHTVLQSAADACRAGLAYFPVCWSYRDPEHTRGYWREEGFGVAAVTRTVFDRACGWDEFTKWGCEDRLFHGKVKDFAEISRPKQPGLFHQWHPPAGRR